MGQSTHLALHFRNTDGIIFVIAGIELTQIVRADAEAEEDLIYHNRQLIA